MKLDMYIKKKVKNQNDRESKRSACARRALLRASSEALGGAVWRRATLGEPFSPGGTTNQSCVVTALMSVTPSRRLHWRAASALETFKIKAQRCSRGEDLVCETPTSDYRRSYHLSAHISVPGMFNYILSCTIRCGGDPTAAMLLFSRKCPPSCPGLRRVAWRAVSRTSQWAEEGRVVPVAAIKHRGRGAPAAQRDMAEARARGAGGF